MNAYNIEYLLDYRILLSSSFETNIKIKFQIFNFEFIASKEFFKIKKKNSI